jgi:hypothetical protein
VVGREVDAVGVTDGAVDDVVVGAAVVESA